MQIDQNVVRHLRSLLKDSERRVAVYADDKEHIQFDFPFPDHEPKSSLGGGFEFVGFLDRATGEIEGQKPETPVQVPPQAPLKIHYSPLWRVCYLFARGVMWVVLACMVLLAAIAGTGSQNRGRR